MAVTVPILLSSLYASTDKAIAAKISIAKGMKVSQSRDNIFGTEGDGSITGKVVSDREGEALSGAWVLASRVPDGDPIGWAISGWDGTYLIAGLLPGEYYLAAIAEGYIPEFYDNVTDPHEATPVFVSDSGFVSDVDFGLIFHGPYQGKGSISGRVVDDDTGRPIEGAHVFAVTFGCIDPATGTDSSCVDTVIWMGEAITGHGGTYNIKGLVTGDYIVSVSAYGYTPEFYDDVLIPEDATPVHVEEPGNTPQIDFGLSEFITGKGSISGVVLSEADSTPVKHAWVAAYSPDNSFSTGIVETRSNGTYRIESLMTGDYYVVARAEEFRAEWYDNVKTEEEATLVPVVSPEETSGIDFYLGYLGSISGRVTSELDGSPVAKAVVCAFPAEDTFFVDPNFLDPDVDATLWSQCTVTDSNGAYSIKGLPSGEYYVGVWILGFLHEWYDDVTNFDGASAVPVVEPENTPDIDFGLSVGGSISGRVISEEDGGPIAKAWVCLEAADDSMWIPMDPVRPEEIRWGCVKTDRDGHYIITGLVAGDYYVRAGAEGFLPEWYDGVRYCEEATPVTVVEETETPDIHFTLSRGGSISGQVLSEPEGYPVHAHVCAILAADTVLFPPDGVWPAHEGVDPFRWARCVETDRSGQYTIDLLSTGEYLVFAWVDDRFLPEWYDDAPTWREATPVAVNDPDDTPNIDFALSLGGQITGRVVSQNQEDPVSGASVCAFQVNSIIPAGEFDPVGFARCAETDERGQYTIRGLKSGAYLVVASAWGYEEQWFEMAMSYHEATPVDVVEPEETTGINFALRPRGGSGSMSGRVVDEQNGNPIPEAYVEARRGDGWWTGRALTREDGTYLIDDLPSGNYYVSVKAKGYHQEFYDDARNPKDATYVAVKDPFNTPDINFELTRKGHSDFEGGITGNVFVESSESDTIPLANALVLALAIEDNSVNDDVGGMAITDNRGSYTISELPGGHYVVMCFAIGYIGELYDDVLDPREATRVKVIPPDVTAGINFVLAPSRWEGGGSIAGRIFDGAPSRPAAEAWVYALDGRGEAVAWDKTGPDGNYLLSGLAPGLYTVQASKVSDGARNVDNIGKSIPVTVGAESLMTVSGVDLVLGSPEILASEDEGATPFIPEGFALEQNYPNPFNPTTTIQYAVVSGQSLPRVTLKIYNLLGQEMRTLVDEPKEVGYYNVTWDGRDDFGRQVASGFYFCRFQAGDYAATIRMVLMK